MEPINGTIATLAEDILDLSKEENGKKPDLIRLCKDHSNPVVLGDNQPVLDITQDDFIRIFDSGPNHFPLSDYQGLRLGMHFRLTLPCIVAMMLKAEWEANFIEMVSHLSSSGNISAKLKEKNLIDKYIPDFRPDSRRISNLVWNISYGQIDKKIISHINYIVSDLLEGKKFLNANKNIGGIFPEKAITEQKLLQSITLQQRSEYLRLKEIWNFKSTEFEDFLLRLEEKKRLNLALESRYFRTFGTLEVDKSRLNCRKENYRYILELMKELPDLSYRELISLAASKMAEAEKDRNELNIRISRSHNRIEDIIESDSNSPVTEEFKNSYRESCKKLLRKLFFLLHPDSCQDYSRLSEYKKGQINKLWLELLKSTNDEMYSFSPHMLLYSLPDLNKLESIYNRACKILGIQAEKVESGDHLEFMINKGSNIGELMIFLQSETCRLELHLSHLELIQDEYSNESQARYFRIALEDINEHTEKLKNEISELKSMISTMKREISGKLKKSTT